jgi:hypothetical protein
MNMIGESRRQQAGKGHTHGEIQRLEAQKRRGARRAGIRSNLAQHNVFLVLGFC